MDWLIEYCKKHLKLPKTKNNIKIFGNKNVQIKKLILALSVLLLLSAGCEQTTRKASIQEQVKSLRHDKKELTLQIKQAEAEKQKLKDQIKLLSGLTTDISLDTIWNLQKIKIGKYTNLFDKDKDGKYEKLIVYLQPIDQDGDAIKAAGNVEVQLWDLDKKDGQMLLGEWEISAEKIRKLWFTTITASNYRLVFDVADKVEQFKDPLTVKITFTDYLTGKVFKEQKIIRPRKP